MVVNELYYGPVWPDTIAPIKAEASTVSISDEIIAAALRNIYRRDFNPHDDIEPNLFNAIAKTLGSAATEGFSAGSGSAAAPSLGQDPFLQALRHSTDVFAAFKTHRAQNDMAARLLDSNGNLKPFKQWKEEVLPIASHQCNNWLQTEYNTAVLRARQAAAWQQFQAEKDIFPNLKWLPSTSPNPGEDHRPFWNTILPVDHPFWDRHRPGDRWNCKCDLTSTDEPATPVPATVPDGSPSGNNPQPGLKDNPGKSQAVFSDDHPYFPSDCKHCAFYNPTIKARLQNIFRAQTKDCYHCPYIDGCINEVGEQQKQLLEERRNEYHRLLKDPDYKDVQFDEKTGGVKATHIGHNEHDPKDNQRFFDNLTKEDLEKECQDWLYQCGHTAILCDESQEDHLGKIPALDLLLDGLLMDIASRTEFGHYGGSINHKQNQLYRIRERTGQISDNLCLYFHDSAMYSHEQMLQDITWFKNHIANLNHELLVKHIYCVVKGIKEIHKYDIE